MSDISVPNYCGKSCDISDDISSVFNASGWYILSVAPNIRAVYATQYKLNGISIFKELTIDHDLNYELHIAGQKVPPIYKIRLKNQDQESCLSEQFDLKNPESLKECVHMITSLDICTGYDGASSDKGSSPWSTLDGGQHVFWRKRSAQCEGLLAGGSVLSSCKECLQEKVTVAGKPTTLTVEQMKMETDQKRADLDTVEEISAPLSCECLAGGTIRNLYNLWQQQAFCDITFIFKDDATIRAHKIVLTATSRYFKQMYSENGIPDFIYLSWCSKDTALTLMNNFYGRGLNVTAENVEELYKLGTAFNMHRVLELCSRFKSSNMKLQSMSTMCPVGLSHSSTGGNIVSSDGMDVVSCKEGGGCPEGPASTNLWNVNKGMVYPGVKHESPKGDSEYSPIICDLYSTNSINVPSATNLVGSKYIPVLDQQLNSSGFPPDAKEKTVRKVSEISDALKTTNDNSCSQNEDISIHSEAIIKEDTKESIDVSQNLNVLPNCSEAIAQSKISTATCSNTKPDGSYHALNLTKQYPCFVCKQMFPYEVALYRHFWQEHSVTAPLAAKDIYELKKEPGDRRKVLVGSCCVGHFKSGPKKSTPLDNQKQPNVIAIKTEQSTGPALQKLRKQWIFTDQIKHLKPSTTLEYHASSQGVFSQGQNNFQDPIPVHKENTAKLTQVDQTKSSRAKSGHVFQLIESEKSLLKEKNVQKTLPPVVSQPLPKGWVYEAVYDQTLQPSTFSAVSLLNAQTKGQDTLTNAENKSLKDENCNYESKTTVPHKLQNSAGFVAESVPGDYRCPVCDCNFKRQTSLKAHMEKSHPAPKIEAPEPHGFPSNKLIPEPNERYLRKKKLDGFDYLKCHSCNLMFTDVSEIQAHSKRKHRLFSCGSCGWAFEDKEGLEDHVKLYSGKCPLAHKCELCYERFSENAPMLEHLWKHIVSLWYEHVSNFGCGLCDGFFHKRISLNAHRDKMKGKCGELPYTCHLCFYGFTKEHTYNKHLAGKHPKSRPFICDICGKGFKDHHILKRHKERAHGLENHNCQNCDKTFKCASSLNDHYRAIHAEKRFWCRLCKQGYCLESHLKQHHLMKHSEGKYSCTKCENRIFKTKQRLKYHVRRVHEKSVPQKTLCQICGKICKSINALKSHNSYHHPKQPRQRYMCDVCGMDLVDHRALENHKNRVHFQIRPFCCDVCGHKSASNLELKQHKLRHSNVRPYKCSTCHKAFKTPPNLRLHETFQHSAQSLVTNCEICGKTVKNKLMLQFHMRLKHSTHKHPLTAPVLRTRAARPVCQ